jgi:hypothetical protein
MIDIQILCRARFRSKIVRRPCGLGKAPGIQRHDAILVSYPRSGRTGVGFLLARALSGRSSEFRAIRAIVAYVGGQRNAMPIFRKAPS